MFSWLVFLSTASLIALSSSDISRTLTTFQNDHYQYVKTVLDGIQSVTDTFVFVENNLKTSIQTYLHNLSTKTLEQLTILRQSCTISQNCLDCFNGTETMEELTQWTVEELQEYLEGRKVQYLEDVQQTKVSVEQSAFLIGVVYEKFKGTETFDQDAAEYYAQTKERLEVHFRLFEAAVGSVQLAMIERGIDTCLEVAEEISVWYQDVVQCVEGVLKLERDGFVVSD